MKNLILIISIIFILFLSLGSIQASQGINDNLTSNIGVEKTFDEIQTEIDNSNESDVIQLDGDYFASSKAIVIDRPLTVKGTNDAKLEGQSKTQILQITSDNVVLENLIFVGGIAPDTAKINGGGAIYATGNNIRIINCTFISNSAAYGGAIESNGDNVSVIDCKFSYNRAETSGAAVELAGDGNLVKNCEFEYNAAGHVGGDVSWIGSNGTLANSTFFECGDSNYPPQYGGAVVWIGSNGKLTQSTFIKKSARRYGAAVYWRGDNGSLTCCIFSNNTSPNDNAYWGNPDYARCNYWGANINSTEEFTSSNLVYYDGAFTSPQNWVNIVETDEWINFTSSDGSPINGYMPDWSFNNSIITNNSFKVKIGVLEDNSSEVIIDVPEANSSKIKIDAVIICNSRTVYNGKYVQIVLNDASGKALSSKYLKITFNGKKYNIATNKKGIANFLVDLKKTGTYKASIVFNGDDDYNSDSMVTKITVKKQKPTLKIATKSLKSKSKRKIVKVYLKDQSKKPISKRTVKFTVNKKTYTVKTNFKGLASFKVTLKAKKNYRCTFKFAGDKYYTSVKKSAKIRVK